MKKNLLFFIILSPLFIIALASVFTGCDDTGKEGCKIKFGLDVKGEVRDQTEIVKRADKNGWLILDSTTVRGVCEMFCEPAFDERDTVNVQTGEHKKFAYTEIVSLINEKEGFFRTIAKNAWRGKNFKYTYDDNDFEGLSSKSVSIGDTIKQVDFALHVKHNGQWSAHKEL